MRTNSFYIMLCVALLVIFIDFPSFAEAQQTVLDGSLGADNESAEDIEEFGGIERGFIKDGPCGIKTVGFGGRFFVAGEKNESLFDSSKDTQGWRKWRTDVARAMTFGWDAKQAGQAQALINVTSDDVSVKWIAYTPGTNIANKFDIKKDAEQLYKSSVHRLILKLQRTKTFAFPAHSNAKKVVLHVQFISDHDLILQSQNVLALKDIPWNERSLRIARICSIFDTMELHQLADHFRELLPVTSRHGFTYPSGPTMMLSIWPDYWFLEVERKYQFSPPKETCDFVQQYIDECLAKNNYIEAEYAAKVFAGYAWLDRGATYYRTKESERRTNLDKVKAGFAETIPPGLKNPLESINRAYAFEESGGPGHPPVELE